MRIIVLLLLTITSFIAKAQNDSTATIYTKDFNTFLHLLQETHPDPYSVFGGKIEFARAAQNASTAIKGTTNIETFKEQLSSFVSQLKDGHTFISSENKLQSNKPNKYFPMVFQVATDGLFVQFTTKEHTACTGRKLLSANGISIDSLLAKTAALGSIENTYGAMLSFRNRIAIQRYASAIFGDKDSIKLTLQDINGDIHKVVAIYAEKLEWNTINSKMNIEKDNNLLYTQILDNSSTAYFAWNGMVSREVAESVEPTDPRYQNVINWAFNLMGKQKPTDEKQALNQIPEIYGTFSSLLKEMRTRKTKFLIIDLRQNGGGMTPLCLPLLYMLYGNKYLNYRSDAQYIQRISPLLLQKWGMTPTDFINTKTDYRLGDYKFNDFHQSSNQQTIEEKQKNLSLIAYKNKFGKEYTQNLNGKPIYEPHVIVLCSPETFSAAYHFMYYLTEIGKATVIGVPSSQAGNAFMEVTPFELPNTKIKGSISNSAQIMFPANEEKGNVFMPDFAMTWKDFTKYEYDENAELFFCLDLIKEGKITTEK